jgi:hypothetical protein
MWREPTGWAGTRVDAGRVPTGPDAPGVHAGGRCRGLAGERPSEILFPLDVSVTRFRPASGFT